MAVEDRKMAHAEFLTGRCPIMAATRAFRMGIDKPDVRRVVCIGSPNSMKECNSRSDAQGSFLFSFIESNLLHDAR